MTMTQQKPIDGKTVLITGGTGSLAKVLVRRLLTSEMGEPKKILLFSRDEGKQHALRLEFMNLKDSTDEVIYNNFNRLIEFHIGDVRDKSSLSRVLSRSNIVINTAAMKQVPACEYFPYEAVLTNVMGAQNLVELISQFHMHVETVVGISTDKACMPINVMGGTKALQERLLLRGNLDAPDTRFFAVRYGNVLASRGSVIPLFVHQIANGGPVTVTHPDMTRFLLSLNEAVDLIFAGLLGAHRGDIYIPIIPAAKISDLAKVMIGARQIEIKVTGVRPGEKMHEMLISEEEARHVMKRGDYYVLPPIYPELNAYEMKDCFALEQPYTSEYNNLDTNGVQQLLARHNLLNRAPSELELVA